MNGAGHIYLFVLSQLHTVCVFSIAVDLLLLQYFFYIALNFIVVLPEELPSGTPKPG